MAERATLPNEQPDGRLRYVAVLAIVAIAVAVRVAWVAYLKVDPRVGRFDDTVFYFASADSLATQFSYRDQFGRLSAQWPPGYPLVVAGVFATVGTKLVAAKALNIAFSAATVLLTYVAGARMFDARAGLVAALLLALAPGNVYFSPLIMTELMFGLGFLATVTLLVRWTIDAPQVSWWWWFRGADDPSFSTSAFSRAQEPRMLAMGIAVGALTLVRSEGVFLVPIFVALWFFVLPRWRPFLWYGAIFFAGFVFTLTPWTVRNFVQFHELIPLRTGSEAGLASGLDRDYPHRIGQPNEPAPTLGEAARYLARHPWEFVPLQGAKLRRLYHDDNDGIDWSPHDGPWKLDPSEIERWSNLADRYFFAVGAGAIAAMPLLWRRRDRGRTVLAYILAAWTGILLIAWPETRYHMPLVPIICMFAGWTIVSAGGAVAARITAMRGAAGPADGSGCAA